MADKKDFREVETNVEEIEEKIMKYFYSINLVEISESCLTG